MPSARSTAPSSSRRSQPTGVPRRTRRCLARRWQAAATHNKTSPAREVRLECGASETVLQSVVTADRSTTASRLENQREQECRNNHNKLKNQRFEDLSRDGEIAQPLRPIRNTHDIQKIQGSPSRCRRSVAVSKSM